VRPIDQTTILITGATDGLGRALAERLAGEGATLLLHGRDPGRLDEITAACERAGATRVQGLRADLAALDEVRELAAAISAATDALHVLVNNAGIGSGRPDGTTRQESRDGYELRFAVNHLAHFLLTLELLPLLRRSAPARIVNVSSLGQAPVDFENVMLERGYAGGRAYGQSKLAQITTGFELAERLPADEVTVNSLHPSTYMPTKMVLEEIGHSVDTLDAGVEATYRLATAPELEGVSGRFFDRLQETRADAQAYDADARRRLWDLSRELTGAPDVS
jgi:NAD(P)-dependent dehydrogenase (short-subunit alcohol dehydrogenase family)